MYYRIYVHPVLICTQISGNDIRHVKQQYSSILDIAIAIHSLVETTFG